MATSEGRARERNPQGEGIRLRAELIAAAGRLLAAGADVETLSLRGVAREAGVAAPSVYLHFASKDALLQEVVEAHFAALRQAIMMGFSSWDDPPANLLAGCLAYCRYAVEQPGSYRILFSTTPLPGLQRSEFSGSQGEAAFQTLVDAVAACIANGTARAGDPFLAATHIWSALHGAATLRRSSPRFPWPPLEAQVRGILEAFTGIPYGDSSASTETPHDGPA